jgi:hypothetical protein
MRKGGKLVADSGPDGKKRVAKRVANLREEPG